MSIRATWSVDALLLLVHIKVSIWILNLAHIWAFLLQTQLLSSIGLSTLCAATVLTFETSHRKIVEIWVLYVAVFRVCAQY